MTTWPSSSAASSSPPDFTAHALSRPPRKKPEPFSQPGRQAEHDQQKLRNTRASDEYREHTGITSTVTGAVAAASRGHRQHGWDDDRVVRLLPLRDRGSAGISAHLLPRADPLRRRDRLVRHPVRRLRSSADRRRDLRALRRPYRP